MPDQTLDRLREWRYALQCFDREQHARAVLAAVKELCGEDSDAAKAVQRALDAKGACLNAAILALDEDLRPGVTAPSAAFPPALPVRTP